ncbi:MAG: hypothetical protein WCG95_04990 [bacterium]
MINPIQIATQYAQMCRSSGGNFLKPSPKLSILNSDCLTFSKIGHNLDDIFESKTLRRLFTDEFKPTRRVDEFGNPITTVIDKKTGKPVEVVINKKSGNRYILTVKNSDGIYESIASLQFSSNQTTFDGHKMTYICSMDATVGNAKYSGAGVRLHQIAIEDSMKNGSGGFVHLYANEKSPIFHYKCGFRLRKSVEDIDIIALESYIKQCIINGKKVDFSGFQMDLFGEQLEKWKARIRTQPILLD